MERLTLMIRMNPKCNHMYKRAVEEDSTRTEETRRRQCRRRFEDSGLKGYNDMAISQGMQSATRN